MLIPKLGQAVTASLNERVSLTVYEDGYIVISKDGGEHIIVLDGEEFEEVFKFYYRNGG